jgi:hypothetical protein
VSCSALKNNTTFGHARAEAFNANAIAPLVVLLVLQDVRVQRSAILALQNITLHTPAMAAALTSNVILGLLAFNDIGIQASAAAALENITVDGGADAVEANAIPALVRLLSSKNVDVLIAVCGALKNMIPARRTRAGTNNQKALKALKSHVRILIYSNNECVKPTAQEHSPWQKLS